MADTKIGNIVNPITTPLGTDKFPVSQGDSTAWFEMRAMLAPTPDRLTLSGTNRLPIAGTSQVLLQGIRNANINYVGSPKTPVVPFTIRDGYYLDVLFRLSLLLGMRATLEGGADLIMSDDFGTRKRIILAG